MMLDIEPVSNQECSGGLFSVDTCKNFTASSEAGNFGFVKECNRNEIQFRIRGLDREKTYTVYIKEGSYDDNIKASSKDQDEEPVLPGTAKFVPGHGAGSVFSSFNSCIKFSPSGKVKPRKMWDDGDASNVYTGIFEIVVATSSVKKVRQSDASRRHNEEIPISPSVFQPGHLLSNGAKAGVELMRQVSSSDQAIRLVESGSRIIQNFVGINPQEENELESIANIGEDISCKLPMAIAVPSSRPSSPMLHAASTDSYIIEDSNFVKKIRCPKRKQKYCNKCGVKTHSQKNFHKLVPLTVQGYVSEGRCLVCDYSNEGENDHFVNRPRCATMDDRIFSKSNFVEYDDLLHMNPEHENRKRSNSDRGLIPVESFEYDDNRRSHSDRGPIRMKSLDYDDNRRSHSDRGIIKLKPRERPHQNKRSIRRKILKGLKRYFHLPPKPDSKGNEKAKKDLRANFEESCDFYDTKQELLRSFTETSNDLKQSPVHENMYPKLDFSDDTWKMEKVHLNQHENSNDGTSIDRDSSKQELLRPFSRTPNHEDEGDMPDIFLPELNFSDENWTMEKVDFNQYVDLFVPLPRDEYKRMLLGNIEKITSPIAKSIRRLNSCFAQRNTSDDMSETLFTVNKTARVLFVGKDGCGRSSLISSLKNPTSDIICDDDDCIDNFGLQVHEWDTQIKGELKDLQLRLWDLTDDETQEMFFSNRAVYVLLWNMGDNVKPPKDRNERKVVNHKLKEDIQNNVLTYLDRITRRISRAVVIPVLTCIDVYDDSERKHRVSIFKESIMNYVKQCSVCPPTLVFSKDFDDVLSVSNMSKFGIEGLRKVLLNIVSANKACHHVGRSIPSQWVQIQHIIEEFRQENKKLCSVQELKCKLRRVESFGDDEIYCALRFFSDIGDISYYSFGEFSARDNQIIFLKPTWLMETVKHIWRSDLRHRVNEIESANDVNEFGLGSTNLPIITSLHARRLLLNCYDANTTTDVSHVVELVLRVLIEYDLMQGISLSNNESDKSLNLDLTSRTTENDTHFIFPSLLQREKSALFTYKCKESWKKTICNTWILSNEKSSFDGIMMDLMYSVVQTLIGATGERGSSELKVRRFLGWRQAFTVFIEYIDYNGTLNTVEICARLVNRSSPHCIGGKFMRDDQTKLILSGKGHVSDSDGSIIWRGGYRLVLNTVRKIIENHLMESKECVACPVCVANLPINEASSWSTSMLDKCGHCVTCDEGHHVDVRLLTGCFQESNQRLIRMSDFNTSFNITTLYESVVLVALWDGEKIVQAGSGFIVDHDKGLIVTSAHTVINMVDGPARFGDRYFSKRYQNPRILIGVLSHSGKADNSYQSVFRYCAYIVAEDVCNVDACVLRISAMFERDLIHRDAEGCNEEPMIPLNSSALRREGLKQLRVTSKCEIEERIAIIGYRQQGRTGVYLSENCNRSIDYNEGYVRELWRNPLCSLELSSEKRRNEFHPTAELMVSCLSIGGYSGGPMVNKKGEVMGILRAGDRDCRQCYVVPSSEWQHIVKAAKEMF